MTAVLKPYSTMKDSGAERLGAVPEHWDVVRLYAIAKPKSIAGQQERELLSVYLDRGVIRFSDVKEKRTNVTSEDLSKYQAVDPGDFVLNNQQAWRGSVGVSRYTGIVSPAYLVLSLNPRINAEYANLLFRERTMVGQYLVSSKGVGSIQRNLYWPHLKRVSTFLPPLPEQVAIVRYLDHVGRRVRRLMRVKRKLIALLTEQKQAIIHRAVTRGLDPDTPLKNSGVEWLGEVPEHWDLMQVRRLIRSGTTVTYGIVQAGPDVEGGIPYIRTSDMKGWEFPKSGYLRTTPEIDASYRRSKVDPGDLVVAIRATLGKALIVPIDLAGANLTQGTARISPGPKVNSRFLFHAFNSYYCQEGIRLIAKGTTFLEITLDALRRILVLLPPLDEQNSIVKYVDRATEDVDGAIARASREIALLDEYRLRITADVVTGKLDVRKVAATLPEFDPLDAEDDLDDTLAANAKADLDAIPEEAEA